MITLINKNFRFSILMMLLVFITGCNDESITGAKLSVGDAAPESDNLTVADSDYWYEVSTMDTKVPLYQWKISSLIQDKKPFLVVFGTPQHCTMCVDQIKRIAVMHELYGDRFSFVHVDGYKDTDVIVEWGVKGEPWTYLVDQEGKIDAIFPGQTEIGLLTMEIDGILGTNSG